MPVLYNAQYCSDLKLTEKSFCTNLLIKEEIIMETKENIKVKTKNIALFLLPVLLLVIILAPEFKGVFVMPGLLAIVYPFVRQIENEKVIA